MDSVGCACSSGRVGFVGHDLGWERVDFAGYALD